jgi:phage gpG-like protein
MDINEFAKQFPERIRKLQEFAKGDDIKDVMGVEAVAHFKQSFDKQGFTDENTEPWADVKRRDPNSEWYGHSGQTGKFSAARTSAKILTGETGELKESTYYAKTEKGVRVYNDKPYARVHNFGGMAKVYGKKAFQMIARPFIGSSTILITNIKTEIKTRAEAILKGN